MKRWLAIFLCAVLAALTAGCGAPGEAPAPSGQSAQTGTPSGAVSPEPLAPMMEENRPDFLPVSSGLEEVESLVFGSEGWTVTSAGPYLFAEGGLYLLRYDVEKNRIDRVAHRGLPYIGEAVQTRFSVDGRYALTYSFSFTQSGQYGYFLLDLQEQTALLLEQGSSAWTTTQLPDGVQAQLDAAGVTLAANKAETGVTRREDGSYWFRAADGSECEMSALRALGCGDYAQIDPTQIGALVQADEAHGLQMGYYRFVVIDTASGEVTQTCALNELA